MSSSHRLYIERRPSGDYAIRKPKSEKASAIAPTQKKAIQLARKMNPGASPDVERVRNTKVGGRDKWRSA